MDILLSLTLTSLATILAIPVTVFCLEVFAAIAMEQKPPKESSRSERGRIAVLVPAHNEGDKLVPTVTDIREQLSDDDRLLVVADNCSDDTAIIAAAAGAEVIERYDTARIGKGFALDFGLRHLACDPPDLVIVIDADCRLAADAIGQLALACTKTGRPAQALYLMTPPIGSEINYQVAEFAWRVKNWVRPLGLKALKLPCQLVGTGMGFPWPVITSADVASGWIVEDLKLGLDLALTGSAPVFCPSARVSSQFARSVKGATDQRNRWEQGHVGMILRAAPRLAATALVYRDLELLALALDLAVPPLSLLVLLSCGVLAATAIAGMIGFSVAPFMISAAGILALTAAISLAWLRHGRDALPGRAILAIPGYIVRKLPLYVRILFGRTTNRWIRTDRT